jgi:hypothetical protein
MSISHNATLCLVVYLSPVLAARAIDPKPPKPDPAKPVNYVEWINRTMGAGLKENAASVYREAYTKCVPFEGDLGDVTAGPWSNNPKVSEWLAANREALKLFRQAAAMSDCLFSLEEGKPSGDSRLDHLLPGLLMPDFRAHRELARALTAEGYQAWSRGDRGLLVANALTVIRSSHHLDHTLVLIERLQGSACLALGHDAIRKAMSLSERPEKTAAAAIAGLRQADPARSSPQLALLGERLAAWDWCQRLFVPGPKPGSWSLHGPLITAMVSDSKTNRSAREWETRLGDLARESMGFDTTMRELNEYFDDLERWYDARYDLVVERTESLNRMIPDSPNPMVRFIAVPNLTRPRVLDDRAVASRRATHLIAHILAYRGRTGRYPASLDDIKAPELEELRIDPLWGRDFVYKTRDGGFTVYSVSENARDDDGRHSEDCKTGDFVFWPVQQPTGTAPGK